MEKLEKNELEAILPVLKTEHTKLNIYPIINQSFEGEIWVESKNNPELVYIWNKTNSHFLLGTSDNETLLNFKIRFFDNKLKMYFKNSITDFVFFYKPEWMKILASLMPNPFRSTFFTKRYLFKITSLNNLVKNINIPENIKIIPVTKNILKRSELVNLSGLTDELKLMWGDIDNFFRYGFGYCAVTENKLAGWCLGEYFNQNYDEKIFGIGIETYPEFQRKNIATAMSQHLITDGLKKGYKIYWDCSKNNLNSVKTAYKLGFNVISEYETVFASIKEY